MVSSGNSAGYAALGVSGAADYERRTIAQMNYSLMQAKNERNQKLAWLKQMEMESMMMSEWLPMEEFELKEDPEDPRSLLMQFLVPIGYTPDVDGTEGGLYNIKAQFSQDILEKTPALDFTSASDVSVLLEGRHLNGAEATWGDKGLAIAGVFLPASGAAMKNGGGALIDFGRKQIDNIFRAGDELVVNFAESQLQSKFKHAPDFGITDNWNKEAAEKFKEAIMDHISKVDEPISGTNRGLEDVFHYFDESTGLNVMTDLDGNFISGWKLSDDQIMNLSLSGNIQ